jgi:hypothetical protein
LTCFLNRIKSVKRFSKDSTCLLYLNCHGQNEPSLKPGRFLRGWRQPKPEDDNSTYTAAVLTFQALILSNLGTSLHCRSRWSSG